MKATELIDRATLLLREGMLGEAQAGYEVAVSVMQLPAAYDGLGSVAFRRKDYSEAAKYFWKAYELDSDYSHVLANLALLYEVTGNRERANELYIRAVKENPDYALVRNNYAVFLAYDFEYEPNADQAYAELQRARVLAQHPVIEDNLKQLSRNP
jgi:Tfp pilus assembly protein PilF